uniref:Uncharacterized protein n=1 Tax=Solanum tuberosum TaxID=4113 RepID=M1DTN5_SOLTU
MWLKFQVVLHPCPKHGMSNKVLLKCFYKGHGPKNRSTSNQLLEGCLLEQPYETIAKLLDGMIKTNEEIKSKQECAIMLTQLNFLSKNVTELEEQSTKKDKQFPLYKCEKGKKQESGQNEEVLAVIQHKIEE